MAPAQISTLLIILFSYLALHVVAVDDRRPPFSHLQPGDVICGSTMFSEVKALNSLTEDCHAALQLIPSGRLTFEGGDPPTWSIEPPAQRRKFLPAAFIYKTCLIRVKGLDSPPLPRSLESLARTRYYHVWPAAREAVERVLQKCRRDDNVNGSVMQTLTFDGHGPHKLWVSIGPSQVLRLSGPAKISIAPDYHVYDAAIGGAGRVTRKEKRSWTKGCLGCPATVE
jgi:hypothetical protein